MSWDYLIITASNRRQAEAYEGQLRVRRAAGRLSEVRRVLVVPDLNDARIGSGGSTLDCLSRVIEMEGGRSGDAEDVLVGLRILIIHAGGDSRRLPAYGPAGKIFIPLPGETKNGAPITLFDRLAPAFLSLETGQIVVAAGDALIDFDASAIDFGAPGFTIAGCYSSPDEASRHGVLCRDEDSSLRLYLQKPSPRAQHALGAIGAAGKAILDIGVMALDAPTAAALLRAFHPLRDIILGCGLDLYREICCGLGTEATLDHYVQSARDSGSKWDKSTLAAVFPALREIPAHVQIVPSCRFLHFGSTLELIESGIELSGATCLSINNQVDSGGRIEGDRVWVEGCRIAAPLTLAGHNAVIGVDVLEPLRLPEEACLEVLAGRARDGTAVWFIRCYGIHDSFKQPALFGRPYPDWMSGIAGSNLWDAAVFPAAKEPTGFQQWLWLFDLQHATPEQKRAFLEADRYSAAEIATLADQDAFYQRRRAFYKTY